MRHSLFWLLGLWCGQAVSAEPLLVGIEELNYLPYYAYQNQQFSGFGHDVLEAFAADSGHTFRYRALPIKRLYIEFLADHLDFKFPDNPYWLATEKNGIAIQYSEPIIEFTDGVLVRPNRVGNGVDTLKIIATVRGFTAFDYLDRIRDGRVKLSEMDTLEALTKATLSGRVDGSYFNVVVAARHLAKTERQPGALVYDPSLPHTDSHYHLSTIRHGDILAEFNAFLRSHPELLAELRKKWEIPAP
ncbi:transporter substrate-binding domain-containing protein [Permianibacter sp. IMCC34836]|uniref:substrate-binding periplasmic protein n=1 Tax=Permianibacter fluminis TaxID=2738515 RepID=UPI00155765E6|nr:transporter substrate-binding domain-containing protein [Permianibacter fluminis]NQD37201.1 transporter substrate-binding domain-containing protein [Permianibacter fluminis]